MSNNENLFEAFSHASSLPAGELATYLSKLKQDDIELYSLLFPMLNKQESGNWTELLSDITTPKIFAPNTLVGETIGEYTLESVLGYGGMGAVYKAKLTKESFTKYFAIKILFEHVDELLGSNGMLHEATMMSLLTHPNIGEVINFGKNSSGQGYIVMEYINGQSIDNFVSSKNLTLKDLLTLFIKICDAIHFAHSSLVLHTDLKPSNILINAKGEPKVIDFGIAKLLSDKSSNANAATQSYLKAVTQHYASPELLRGEKTSAQTDVYSLGVLFNELLHKYQKLPINKNERNELRSIFSKASEADKKQRFASVYEIKRQLLLIQQGNVADTYQPSAIYKLKKLVFKRKPVASVAIVIMTISLITITATSIYSNIEIQAQKKQSDLVADSLATMLSITDPNKRNGEAIFAGDLLREGEKLLASDSSLLPNTKARIYIAIADSYFGMGDYKQAEPIYWQVLDLVNNDTKLNISYRAADKLAQLFQNDSAPEKAIQGLQYLAQNIFTDWPTSIEQARFYSAFLSNKQLISTGSFEGDFSKRKKDILRYMLNQFSNEMKSDEVINLQLTLAKSLYYSLPSNAHHTYFQVQDLVNNTSRTKVLAEAQSLLLSALNLAIENALEKTLIAKLKMWTARIIAELGDFERANQYAVDAINIIEPILGKQHNDARYARLIAMIVNYYSEPTLALAYAKENYQQVLNNPEHSVEEEALYADYLMDALGNNGQIADFKELYEQTIQAFIINPDKASMMLINVSILNTQKYLYLTLSTPKESNTLIQAFRQVLPNITIPPIKQRTIELINKLEYVNGQINKLGDNIQPQNFYAQPLTHQSNEINQFEKSLDIMLHARFLSHAGKHQEALALINSKLKFSWSDIELSSLFAPLKVDFLMANLLLKNNSIEKAKLLLNKIELKLNKINFSIDSAYHGEFLLLKALLAFKSNDTDKASSYITDSNKIISNQYPANSLIRLQQSKIQSHLEQYEF
jgi:serine/threonine protein kinase